MIETLTQYYGLDWIAGILTLFGVYMLGNHKRVGFIYSTIALVCASAVCIMIQSIPFVLMNLIVMVLNIRGYMKWGTRS